MPADKWVMRKQAVVFIVFMLVFAGLGSAALAKQSSARSQQSAAVRAEKRLGPNPLPHWYWRWVDWRLGEGYAKGHGLQARLRPSDAPPLIERWAWRRLHLFLLARGLRGGGNGPVSSGTNSYNHAIAYTRHRPAFTAKRTIAVRNAAELEAAISNLQPGDLVKATARFTVSNSSSAALVIRSRLSAPAEIDLSGVKIVYSAAQDVDGGAG